MIEMICISGHFILLFEKVLTGLNEKMIKMTDFLVLNENVNSSSPKWFRKLMQVKHNAILGYIENFLVSRPLQIEKVMHACDFCSYFLSFLQGRIEIFETGIILHFPHIVKMYFYHKKQIVKSDSNLS